MLLLAALLGASVYAGNPTRVPTCGRVPNASTSPAFPFVIPPSQVASLKTAWDCASTDALLRALVMYAIAEPGMYEPISDYKVGMAGLGESGHVYLGINLEFPGAAIGSTVHAEQFVTSSCMLNNETRLLTLVGHDCCPCGHCRQFLSELVNAEGATVSLFLWCIILTPPSTAIRAATTRNDEPDAARLASSDAGRHLPHPVLSVRPQQHVPPALHRPRLHAPVATAGAQPAGACFPKQRQRGDHADRAPFTCSSRCPQRGATAGFRIAHRRAHRRRRIGRRPVRN